MKDPPKCKTKPIVPAKLTRPDSRGVLPRERLFHAIHAGCNRKVIWISGPAGSGKTTLVANFMDNRNFSCLWYQIDEGDADLSTFYYYLGLAAKKATPYIRKPLPLFTPEYLHGTLVFAKRFFEQLAERLMERSRSSGEHGSPSIVLDNYQDIPENSLFHAAINAGIESIPRGMNVLILSRIEPPAAFARLRAAGEMHLIGWDDVRLTADESNEIVMRKAGRTGLSAETLARLYETTDGWAAGLVLIMENIRNLKFDYKLPHGLPKEDIFAYFTTELFDRISQNGRIFLMETSFLPDIDIQTAEALTGNVRAGHIFFDLNRKNYFINSYTSEKKVFQYHPLFQEFLQIKAASTFTPEHIREIRCRAAQLLEQNGRCEDAVRLFIEAEKWDEAAQAVLTHAPDMVSQGRWQMLIEWINSFPFSIMENRPWLFYWKGICRFPTSPSGSMEYFAEAFDRFKRCKDAAGAFLALAGMLDSVNFRLDTYFELDHLISMMDELMVEYPEFPSTEIESHVVNSMLNALTLRQPFNPAWNDWEKRGVALLRNIKDMDVAIHILCGLAFYRLFSGEIEKVMPILESIDHRIFADNASMLAVLSLRDLQAFHHWLSADFEKNRQAVEDGIALADSSGVHYMDIYLLGHGTAGALSIGEIERAEGYLDKMLAAIRMMPSTYGEYFYHNLMAWKYLIERRLTKASIHADLGLGLSAVMGAPLMVPAPHVIKAIILHELKDDEKAREHLNEIRKVCGTMSLFQAEFMVYLTDAQIAFDHGDESNGRDLLRKAMVLGKEHKYANGFFWVSATMAKLCLKAVEAGIETDYVLSLILKRNLVPDRLPLHVEAWPWPIKFYTLGPFEMVRDGELVRFTGKVQQKPLSLLKALIAFGGDHVNEERLCDALWPDADGDLAHNSLETTLYRLRKLIGKDKTIHHHNGCLTLNRKSCWVDVFALEQLMNKAVELFETIKHHPADSLKPQKMASEAIHLTHQAITLYKGDFLSSETEQSWLIASRKRLRLKFLEGVKALACYLEMTGDIQAAIKYYHKALEADALAEEFYQKLMMLYQRLNQPAKAVEVYKLCHTALQEELGVLPSPETLAILKAIR